MTSDLDSLLWMAFSAGFVNGDEHTQDYPSSEDIHEMYNEWVSRDYVQRTLAEAGSKTQDSLGNVSRSGGMDLNSLCYSVARWIDLASVEGLNRGLVHLDTMKEIYEELSRLRDLER